MEFSGNEIKPALANPGVFGNLHKWKVQLRTLSLWFSLVQNEINRSKSLAGYLGAVLCSFCCTASAVCFLLGLCYVQGLSPTLSLSNSLHRSVSVHRDAVTLDCILLQALP